MAKVKIGQWEIEEELLEQQHQAALQQGARKTQNEPQAQTALYDVNTNRLVIELKNGVIFQLPCPLIEGLRDAPPDAIAQVYLGPRGASLHWEQLNLDFSLAGLLAGLFGTQVWMAELGRTGGRARSAAKTNAARANGKKGGRPAQTPQVTV